jgi:hypothetical protein
MFRIMLFLSVLVWLSVPHSAAAQSTKPVLAAQSDAEKQELEKLSSERQSASENLEKVDKQVGHLEQELVAMLALMTLGAAFFVGSVIVGEYRIRQGVRELENLAQEVKQRFPMLARMEEQVRHVLDKLEDMFGAEEWEEDRYARLSLAKRQDVLTVEPLIALEFTGPTTVAQLRGMANFYSSKFTAEKLPYDLDRALYYALLASQRGKGKFQFKYLNDLGLIYMDLGDRDREFLKDAKESFLQSKQNHPDQQRCYYNLGTMYVNEAVVCLSEGKNVPAKALLMKARDELTSALTHNNWESGPSPNLTSAIHYNLACCLCRLAEDVAPVQGPSDAYTEVVAHLQSASKQRQTKTATLDHDLDSAEGDLRALKKNHFYAASIKAIRADFEKAWEG